jgi:hypothetical protein
LCQLQRLRFGKQLGQFEKHTRLCDVHCPSRVFAVIVSPSTPQRPDFTKQALISSHNGCGHSARFRTDFAL